MSEFHVGGGGGAGTDPKFTKSAVFPSGLDSSGLVAVPSLLVASVLNASGTIAGTIGNFLATALAGSGFNASGPTQLTTLSATDITVSTVNGLPVVTSVASTFTSGLTACALLSAGASAIFNASAVFES